MILAFVAGWIVGSLTLYSYVVMTARETPFPDCMDCREPECGDCSTARGDDGRIRLAA